MPPQEPSANPQNSVNPSQVPPLPSSQPSTITPQPVVGYTEQPNAQNVPPMPVAPTVGASFVASPQPGIPAQPLQQPLNQGQAVSPYQQPFQQGIQVKKKSHKTLWVVLSTVFGVLIIGFIALIVIGVSATSAPTKLSNEFVNDLQNGNYPAAYELTDKTITQDSFTQLMTSYADIVKAPTHDIKRSLDTKSSSASVATIDYAQGSSSTRKFSVFVTKYTSWQVSGLSTK